MSNVLDLKETIEKSTTIAIFSHTAPDADAICSSLALKNLIETNFEEKQVDIFIDTPEGVPALYEPVVGDAKLNEQRAQKYDLAVALDCPQTNRFAKYEHLFNSAKTTVNIDHHESNSSFAELNFVGHRASSTCEMLFQFAKRLELDITPEFAKNIFTGIITDTVCLTQSNVTKLTYKILAELSSMPFDSDAVKNYFFKNNTKAKTFLLEKALSSIRFFEDDKIAIMKITKKDLEKLEATQEDTLGIVEHANNIEGVLMAGIIIENDPQKFYVSLRGKGEIKIADIAKEFGGGGHLNMAAFQYEGELKELNSQLIKLSITAVKEREAQILEESEQEEQIVLEEK